MAKSRNSVSGAGPSNLPGPLMHTAFFPREGEGGPHGQEKQAVYISGPGRFEGPAPDTEFRDLAT